ncbi:MAG: MFS transporter [Vicinamibacterales bacterium]
MSEPANADTPPTDGSASHSAGPTDTFAEGTTPLGASVNRHVSTFARRIAPALFHRDFAVLWTGAFLSTIGTWMQSVAQDWLIVELTGSPSYNGLNNFLAQAPFLIFTLIGGVVADRHSRRLLLMGSQYVQMCCALVLTALVYFQQIHIWHILAISFAAGIAQAFGGPAYQSLIPTLVPKRDLPNAIAFNSIQFNLARMLGPTFAGPALALLGMAACFGINAVSFLVVIAALMLLHVPHTPPQNRQPLLDELRGGLSYVQQSPPIRLLMLLAFLGTFLALPLQTLLPSIVQKEFGQNAAQFARMVTFSGAGAVLGALVIAWLGRSQNMGRTLLTGQAVLAVLIFAFSQSRHLLLSELLLFAIGSVNIVVFSMTTSLVQLVAPDEMRGRVMSIYMLAFRGGMPLGALVAGYAASLFSAPAVLAVNATLLMLVAAYFFFAHKGIRQL